MCPLLHYFICELQHDLFLYSTGAAERFLAACDGIIYGAVLLPPKHRSAAPRATAVLGGLGEVQDGIANSMLQVCVSESQRESARARAYVFVYVCLG